MGHHQAHIFGTQMPIIDRNGIAIHSLIKPAIAPTIERGEMKEIHGIIVHQTGGSTAQSSIDSYKNPSANGAHFLIEKDGTIYQTASLYKQTWHIGKIKARCLLEKRCTPVELKSLQRFNPTQENKREMLKKVPARFPANQDSIGIELVGEALPRGGNIPDEKKTYQAVTSEQNNALQWLIAELTLTLRISMSEVFRHPEVSRKNPTEAISAKW